MFTLLMLLMLLMLLLLLLLLLPPPPLLLLLMRRLCRWLCRRLCRLVVAAELSVAMTYFLAAATIDLATATAKKVTWPHKLDMNVN